MHRQPVVSLLLLAAVLNARATGISPYPHEVEDFIDRRELCDHFRGEEPYDSERAEFLARRIDETCSGTDEELLKLKGKYEDDEEIMRILNRFEEDIEADDGT
ncbi:MAG: hypothetical protein ACE5FV_00755 [Woeseia sp.]